MHNCPYCQRAYSRKIYFDRHVGICEYLAKSKREKKIDNEERHNTPSISDLYTVVMELVIKNKQLEEKVEELIKRGGVTKQKQKLNHIEWLNTTFTHAADYNGWLKNVVVTRDDLNIFFDTDYVGGVMSALKQQLVLSDEERPLRASDQANVFYVFIDNKWIQMDNETYLKIMYVFDQKIMIEFGHWQQENKEKLFRDNFSHKFNKYMKNMMATREPLYSRVKKGLFNYLRETIRL